MRLLLSLLLLLVGWGRGDLKMSLMVAQFESRYSKALSFASAWGHHGHDDVSTCHGAAA